MLNLKGAAFLCRIDDKNNKLVSIPRNTSSADNLQLSLEEVNNSESFILEFVGKSMDLGFRIIERSSRHKFMVNVEIVRSFISHIKESKSGSGWHEEFLEIFRFYGFRNLKGFSFKRGYPLFFILRLGKYSDHYDFIDVQAKLNIDKIEDYVLNKYTDDIGRFYEGDIFTDEPIAYKVEASYENIESVSPAIDELQEPYDQPPNDEMPDNVLSSEIDKLIELNFLN